MPKKDIYFTGSPVELEKIILQSKYTYHFHHLAKNGRVDVFTFLERRGICIPDEEDLLYTAAKYEKIDMIKWLCSRNVRISDNVYFILAENGSLSILQWLYTQEDIRPPSGLPMNMTLYAIQSRRLDLVSWLHEIGMVFGMEDMLEATKIGCLPILKWLREKGCPFDVSLCSSGAFWGHFHIVKWLHENGCPWDYSTCSSASLRGRKKILQYALDHGCPLSESVMIYAARYGRLEIMKLLYEYGCPMNGDTFDVAFLSGKLEVLEWLKEKKCPWGGMNLLQKDQIPLHWFAQKKEDQFFRWLFDANYPQIRNHMRMILEHTITRKNYIYLAYYSCYVTLTEEEELYVHKFLKEVDAFRHMLPEDLFWLILSY